MSQRQLVRLESRYAVHNLTIMTSIFQLFNVMSLFQIAELLKVTKTFTIKPFLNGDRNFPMQFMLPH